MLNEGSHKYHTFKLPEENELRSVLGGIVHVISTDNVKHNDKPIVPVK